MNALAASYFAISTLNQEITSFSLECCTLSSTWCQYDICLKELRRNVFAMRHRIDRKLAKLFDGNGVIVRVF
jgi:hypothetical protein